MQTMITRTGFCPVCAKERRPRINQTFLVYGNNGFHVKTAVRNGEIGFVPFIYRLVKVIGQNVIVERTCSMYECGVMRDSDGIGNWFSMDKSKAERIILTFETWNALVNYKRDFDYLI